MRQTKLDAFEIFISGNIWRARIEILSTTGDDEQSSNFRAMINAPIKNYDKSPVQIKQEIFQDLVQAFGEVYKEISSKKFEDLSFE